MMALANNFLQQDGLERTAVGHESSAYSKLQDSDESSVALTDVHSVVTFDHVMGQDPIVANDLEPIDTTSDMTLQPQSVQCSESSVSTTSPYHNGMKLHSDPPVEQIRIGLGNLGLAEKDDGTRQLKSIVPQQVEGEKETSCCDMTLSNRGNVRKMGRNGCAVVSNPKQPAEQLQQLNISFRNGTSANSSSIASAFELRPSLSREEQNMCCGNMEDKLGEDRYVEPKVALGHGSFGVVYIDYHKDSGTLFAIKKVIFTNGGKDEVMKEVHIMTGLCHPNIIKLLGSRILGMACWISLEWMAGGSVQQLLSKYGPMSGTVIHRYSEQVLSGIAYLHGRKILHCDVKGANIVVDSTGQVAKLCDFGQAVKMPVPEGMEGKGTHAFMAPELFQGSCNSRGSDVWSFGCTMIEMATGNLPWSEFHHFGVPCVIFKICTEELPIPPSLPLLLHKVIANCLQKDVANRPAAHVLQCRLAMPFLVDMSASPYVHDY